MGEAVTSERMAAASAPYLQDLFYPVTPLAFNCLVCLSTVLIGAWVIRLSKQAARLVHLRTAIAGQRLRQLDLDLMPFPEVKYFSRQQLAEHLQTRAPPPPLTLAPLHVPTVVSRNTIHLTVSDAIAALDFRIDASKPATVTVLVNADCKEVDEAIAKYEEEARALAAPKAAKKGRAKGKAHPTCKPGAPGKGKGKDVNSGGKAREESAGKSDRNGAQKRLDWMSMIAKSARYYGTSPPKAVTAAEISQQLPDARSLAAASNTLCEKLKMLAQVTHEPMSLPQGLGQRVDVSIINAAAVAALRKPPSADKPRYALIIISSPNEPDKSGELVRMITMVWDQKLPFLITPEVVKRVAITSSGCFTMEDIFGAEVDESKQNLTAEDCAVCLANPRSVIILPCRHKCVCNSCFTKMSRTNCPVCRSLVASFVQTTADNVEEPQPAGT